MMYALYMQRLMTSSLPSPSTRPGMYVSVGPAGYTAAGLMSLASRAPSVLPKGNDFASSSLSNNATAIQTIGLAAGLFIILFAVWFFCITTVAILFGVRRMRFTLNWWAFIFPNAGLCLAAIQAGKALQSEGIDGVCSALTVVLVLMWFVVAGFCLRALWRGEVMWPGVDEDKTMEGIPWGRRGGWMENGEAEKQR